MGKGERNGRVESGGVGGWIREGRRGFHIQDLPSNFLGRMGKMSGKMRLDSLLSGFAFDLLLQRCWGWTRWRPISSIEHQIWTPSEYNTW